MTLNYYGNRSIFTRLSRNLIRLIKIAFYRLKELKEENDDEEELESKRRMDAYKDEHKRGEGNRHNMG